MRKTAWLGALVGCGVVLSAWLAVRAQRAEEAAALTERGVRFLRAPVSEAPSLSDVRAREARELFEEAHTLEPDDARAALLLEARVTELYGRGELLRAAKLLSDAHTNAPHLRVLAAAISLGRGDPRTAQNQLDALPESLRDDTRALLLRSDTARALGRPDIALAAAERGLALDTGRVSAAFYERHGLAHELLGDRSQALTDLEHAAQLDRRSSSALLALGRLHRSAHELSQAVLAFHEAQQRNPNEAEAWLGSGVCREEMGERVAARSELERAAELAPTRAEPLIALADVDVAEKNLPMALRRYRAALLLDPHSALGYVKFGNALMRDHSYQAAVKQFQSAITDRPDLAAAHNGLGAALFAIADLAQAEQELKTAARLDPSDARPFLNLARLYKQRGDETLLAEALSHARERDPQLALAHDIRIQHP